MSAPPDWLTLVVVIPRVVGTVHAYAAQLMLNAVLDQAPREQLLLPLGVPVYPLLQVRATVELTLCGAVESL